MSYFISQELYERVNHNKLLCRDMNFRHYINKIKPSIKFLWKYRNVLDWTYCTHLLKTEAHIHKFSQYIDKYQLSTNMKVSDDFACEYIKVLPTEVLLNEQRSEKFLDLYLYTKNIFRSYKEIIRKQKLPVSVLDKYKHKFELEDILHYQTDLPVSYIEYLLISCSKSNIGDMLSIAMKNYKLDWRFLITYIRFMNISDATRIFPKYVLVRCGLIQQDSYEEWLQQSRIDNSPFKPFRHALTMNEV